MIVDLAESSADTLPDFDVCVAGAGVAGLTAALQLAARGRRVALLEAGGRDGSAASQDFYRGENTGVENLPLDQTRLRQLGGSSNHWGGWCRPLDAYDLARTDLTGAGWPIAIADLAPYGKKAGDVLGINAANGADLPLTDADGNLETIRMFFSRPPAHLGDRFYDALETTPNLSLFLNAAVAAPQFDASGRVVSLSVRAPGGGIAFQIRARYFVLALGTVENTRMLLLWNRDNAGRLANPQHLGRRYMQHLHQEIGQFVLFDDAAAPGLSPAAAGDTQSFMSSTESFLQKTGVGAFRLYSTEMSCAPLVDQLSGIATAAACSSISTGGHLFITAEQAPNDASRITLGTDVDAFGQPRAKLDWQIDKRDVETLRQSAMEFGRYLIRAKLGRLKVNPAILDGDAPLAGWSALPSAPGAAGHQMGGIRMSATADDGVTDRDCRLWGVDNVYVGGSGVFRTSGHANPTFTLTQLALRIADTLHRRLGA